MSNRKKYIGTIDDHGVESLIPQSRDNVYPLVMQAEFNSHKSAVVYRLELEEEEYEDIKAAIDINKKIIYGLIRSNPTFSIINRRNNNKVLKRLDDLFKYFTFTGGDIDESKL